MNTPHSRRFAQFEGVVVSTNFVFGGRNGKTDLCFTLALTCVLSPGERILAIMVSVIRLVVWQIQSREFSRRRRMILLLLGEKAGLREGVTTYQFVELDFLEEYRLGEKAPHAHTNCKREFSKFAGLVVQYQNSPVNHCI